MKLRTTVQLSGAISNTIQKSKPPLKREDSFLKRFSTRQIPEAQETEQTNGTRTQEEVNRRRRKRRKEQSRTVVNPDENFYFYWLMTVTVCVLYNLWTLIVRQSFPELQKDSSAFWYACDGFTDVVFVCDIAVQFRTGYLEQGLMVYDSRKLAKHYLKSRAFAFDLISLIPLDLLQMEIGTNPILRFPRFLKIYRVYSYYYIVESRTVYPNLWRVINLIHILLILAHWFGCFYYLLSEAEGFQGAWVYPFRQGDDATLTRKYLGSLYWSTLTLTTIGDLPTPETNADAFSLFSDRLDRRRGPSPRLLTVPCFRYVFTIVSYLIGVFIFATIVGQVGNVITNRNANRLEFERLLDGAKTYMRHHKVPGGMKRRVLRWYDYSWSRGRIQGGGDINTALGLLPDKLKTELALHVNLSVLKKVTIFQECQPEFLHDLVLKMKAYIFTPGDLICRKGEIAREMFIIADGILDVISDTGRVLTTMKAGDFFGEIGILNLDGLNKRTADVRSVGYSELFSLSREDVLTAMKDYPEAQEILQNLGRKRLMEARNASKILKPIKEHESPGESENAGKRIVEKLRSDVKGLKNALRRSRRESRDEDDCESYGDGYGAKLQVKKPSILRRMSHVQSSDECETNETTPIGAGLPLLQRLKLLKEKQDREKEEKNKMSTSLPKRDNCGAADNVRLQAPKPVPDRESEISAEVFSEESVLSSREPDSRPKECSLPEDGIERDTANSDILPSGGSRGLLSFDDVGTGTLGEQSATNADSDGKENHSKRPQDFEMPKMSSAFDRDFGNQETSIQSKHVPKAKGNLVNSVPKQSLGSKLEVPKNKWNLFKKSSGQEKRPDGETAVKSREFYLSKSDTVLERQQSIEPTMGKRSRSMSPSDESKNRKRTLKSVVEYIIGQRRRSSSLGRSGRMRCDENPATDPPRPFGHSIKKYDSIDDLSPEYSGLPFVQKLKILNERQKLAELVENELVVRSASLEIPERAPEDESLPRSLSVASTIDLHGERGRTPSKTAAEMDCRIPLSRPRPFRPEDRYVPTNDSAPRVAE
ncbi:UNVERIFIED_CONTAM: hypothetical protein PYX00_008888 [Menopon gallinae]|uniref:Cyclic nucleotide-binding domain-containing protein n=1 Tax=Menopon gallinae TaxID=328185 RepID=A0AAW2H8Z9_9NEOP